MRKWAFCLVCQDGGAEPRAHPVDRPDDAGFIDPDRARPASLAKPA
jgi:hypothetical protein